MHGWRQLLEQVDAGDHLVQFYGCNDQLLARDVTRYFAAGLRRGDGLLMIGTPEHNAAVAHQVRQESARFECGPVRNRPVYLDARRTLARFMRSGRPDRPRFRQVVGAAIREARGQSGRRVRAFGEMVGLLWRDGGTAAAIELEQYWDELLQEGGMSLLCAYPVDLFAGELETSEFNSLLDAHSHLCAGPKTLFSNPRFPADSTAPPVSPTPG